jgi:hypothetical protein
MDVPQQPAGTAGNANICNRWSRLLRRCCRCCDALCVTTLCDVQQQVAALLYGCDSSVIVVFLHDTSAHTTTHAQCIEPQVELL